MGWGDRRTGRLGDLPGLDSGRKCVRVPCRASRSTVTDGRIKNATTESPITVSGVSGNANSRTGQIDAWALQVLRSPRHGRLEVAKIARHRTRTKVGRRTRETVYVLTDLTSRQAFPERVTKIVR